MKMIVLLAFFCVSQILAETPEEAVARLEKELEEQREQLLKTRRSETGPSFETVDGKLHIIAKDVMVQAEEDMYSVTDVHNTAAELTKSLAGVVEDMVSNFSDVRDIQRRSANNLSEAIMNHHDTTVEHLTRLEMNIGGLLSDLNTSVTGNLGEKVNALEKSTSEGFKTVASGQNDLQRELEKNISNAVEEIKLFNLDRQCAMENKDKKYDSDSKTCVCSKEGYTPNGVNGACIPPLGTDKFPARDCAHLKSVNPNAKSGAYSFKLGSTAFTSYCDMDSYGGGWTMLESYDVIKHRQTYARAPFNKNMPRNADKPPKSSASSDAAWDDFRLSSVAMQALIDRSVQVHARCHRVASQSTNDWLIGDSSMIKFFYGGAPTNPHSNTYTSFSLRGKLRGFVLGQQENFAWYHGNPWHAGFDLSGKPNAVASEDAFTWHDGGLQARHKCHTAGGEVVWFVRGPGGLGSPEEPAQSCDHILKVTPEARERSGPYWLQLKSGLQRVYCEMTTHDGGWTLFLAASYNDEVYSWASNSPQGTKNVGGTTIQRPYGYSSLVTKFKLSADDINGIRESWKEWGPAIGYAASDSDKGYWTTTPGFYNGYWGAERFQRKDCIYYANRRENTISRDSCGYNVWKYSMTTWEAGGHWWQNNGCYASWGGHWAMGYRSRGYCYSDGRGLNYHCGGLRPFHIGWCGGRSWGLEFVR
eukprot:m.335863 g.335863  ORF g.335863 m.335863 type:complete len:700 (+) comp17697_c0_seq1:171-2270(+)